MPVFDSSTIDIPNPPTIKFSSFEGQPLVAWRPSSKKQDIPFGERSTSKQGKSLKSPRDRDRSPDIVLEGRASAKVRNPDKAKRNNAKASKKWSKESGDFDKRSKSIIDILKTKRESIEHGCNRRNELYNSYDQTNGELTHDKVIKYPTFIVREKKKKRKEISVEEPKTDEPIHTTQKPRIRPLKEHVIRDYFNSMDMAAATLNDQVDLQRAVDSRRSFRPKKITRSSLYEFTGSGNNTPKGGNKYASPNFGRYSGFDNGHEESVDDIIMGLYPDENMPDGLHGKAMNQQGRVGSVSPQKQRTQSPPYEQVPPPPTPASQLLMHLGVANPNDHETLEEEWKIEERLERERRLALRERTRNRDKSNGTSKRDQSDPGVSNTTHHLLEANIIRRQFVFPCLSPESRRKAITTRVDDKQHLYRMSPGNITRSKSSMNGQSFYPVHPAAQVHSYDINHGGEATPPEREKSASKIDLSASHDQLPTAAEQQRAHSSLGMAGGGVTRSQSFYHGQKRPTKYNKMISLGLPKVNIDIDRNHFSQGNIARRSLEMREKYQIPDNIRDVKVGENNGTKYLKKNNHADKENDHDDRKSVCSQASVAHMDSNGDIEPLQIHRNDGNITPDTSSQIQFRPPPNTPINGESSVFQRRSTVRKSSSKIPVKVKQVKQTSPAKNPVNMSYFKMAPPGDNGADSLRIEPSKHSNGVVKTLEIEIAL